MNLSSRMFFGTGAWHAYAKFFIGQSFLNSLTDPKTGLFLTNVAPLSPAANNWHIHHAAKGGGQLLVCTAGEGWYQERQTCRQPDPGTVITIPANVKHWHGAKADSWFSHIAVEVPGEDCSNEWCEPVTDEEYAKLNGMSSRYTAKATPRQLPKMPCGLGIAPGAKAPLHRHSGSMPQLPHLARRIGT